MTSFADLRELGENLARFASIREKADRPMDRIVVQANNGVLKLIAGDYGKTLIATVGPTTQDGRAVVPSRLLLGAIKTLKAKGEADILIVDDGAVIKTGFGSEIEMKNMDGPFTMLRPTPYVQGEGFKATFPEGFLPAASKYLSQCIGDFSPFDQVVLQARKGRVTLTASDDHLHTEVDGMVPDGDFTVHFPGHVWPALKGMDAAGGLWLPEHKTQHAPQVQIGAGKYRVVSVIWPDYPAFPALKPHKYSATVTGNKKVFIEAFKALAGRHEFSRVIMDTGNGEFTVRGGDAGAAKVVAQVEGRGTLPVNATFMAKVLNTVDGTNVTFQYSDAPSLVRVVGDKNQWPVSLSPMK